MKNCSITYEIMNAMNQIEKEKGYWLVNYELYDCLQNSLASRRTHLTRKCQSLQYWLGIYLVFPSTMSFKMSRFRGHCKFAIDLRVGKRKERLPLWLIEWKWLYYARRATLESAESKHLAQQSTFPLFFDVDKNHLYYIHFFCKHTTLVMGFSLRFSSFCLVFNSGHSNN